MVKYLPYADRTPDTQYRRVLKRILTKGELTTSHHTQDSIALIQETMRFDLANGFPLIPDRDCSKFWNKGIGELCAFINGVTDSATLREYGADWWGAWTTPEKCDFFGLPHGEIGPASYGGAFAAFPTLAGGTFDQFDNLVRQIKERPSERVHAVTNWMPAENARGEGFRQGNTIAPCHGDLNVFVINGRLHLHMKQRSADVPVGVPSNIAQYAGLLLMLEQLTGFKAGVLYITLVNAHIYENQIALMRQLVRRKPGKFPTVKLTKEGRQITDIKAFRREHFQLSDYHPHPAMPSIPVST